jgi:putative glutathione S-transferase
MARLTAIARLVAVLTAAAVSAFTAVPLPQAARRCPTKPVVAAWMAEEARGGLRILEWIPSQQLLVGTAKFVVNTLWLIMVSELAPQSKEGDYLRPAPQLGAAATWPADLPGVAGRYHVYVGNACPWCHRVSIVLALRELSGNVISSTRLDDDPQRASRGGWCFSASDPDPLCGAADLREVYNHCTEGGKFEGRCTAPLLVDLETGRIISNESGDIVRMLNSFPRESGLGSGVDLYPAHLRAEVDDTNAWVYEQINNGVYRCGFATKQAAYERAERDVHAGLARVDELLSTRRFLCGETLSEADVRLLPTGARFDGCYTAFFRCGRRQIRSDYPHLARWLREMLELTGPLFDLDDARRSYYTNLFPLNPGGIVPAGPTPADLGFPDAPVAQMDASAFSYYDDRGES